MRAGQSFVKFGSEKACFIFFPNGRCLCVLKAQRMEQYRGKDSEWFTEPTWRRRARWGPPGDPVNPDSEEGGGAGRPVGATALTSLRFLLSDGRGTFRVGRALRVA